MADITCEECQSLISELALGVVHGRERADALAHIEYCPVCRQELLLMGDLADRLVELTPSAEPPPGFETRVLAALGTPREASGPVRAIGSSPRSGNRGRPGWFRPAVLTLVAAVLTAAVGVGGWALGHHSVSTPPAVASAGGRPVVAELVADHRYVGQVFLYGGTHPWVSMAVQTSLGNQQVTCQLRFEDGRTADLGSFTLSGGEGYWAAAVPATSSPVTGARLLEPSGSVFATATLAVAVTPRT